MPCRYLIIWFDLVLDRALGSPHDTVQVYTLHGCRKVHKDHCSRLKFNSSATITVSKQSFTLLSLFPTLLQSLYNFDLRIHLINNFYLPVFLKSKPKKHTTATMVSTTINFSGLMCLVLALGPATVLSAPQVPAPQLPALPFPEIINHGPETTNLGPDNSETSAGSGVKVGIPGGPYVNVGAGFLDSHRGPCGPGSGDDHLAGAGVDVGIPGGPRVNVGNGEHHHQDGYPCPEPPAVVVVPTPTANPPPVVVVPTTTVSPPTEIITPPAETAHPPTWTGVPTILPPTFTTPISGPLTTAPAGWVPAPAQSSTPLIHHAVPTASASPSAVPSVPVVPVFNAGSSLVPGSVLAVALPVIVAFFQ